MAKLPKSNKKLSGSRLTDDEIEVRVQFQFSERASRCVAWRGVLSKVTDFFVRARAVRVQSISRFVCSAVFVVLPFLCLTSNGPNNIAAWSDPARNIALNLVIAHLGLAPAAASSFWTMARSTVYHAHREYGGKLRLNVRCLPGRVQRPSTPPLSVPVTALAVNQSW